MPRHRQTINYRQMHHSGLQTSVPNSSDPRGAGGQVSSTSAADCSQSQNTSFLSKLANYVSPWRSRPQDKPEDSRVGKGESSNRTLSAASSAKLEEQGSELDYSSDDQGAQAHAPTSEVLEFADEYPDEDFVETVGGGPELDASGSNLLQLKARLDRAKQSRDEIMAKRQVALEKARVQAELDTVERELRQLQQGRRKQKGDVSTGIAKPANTSSRADLNCKVMGGAGEIRQSHRRPIQPEFDSDSDIETGESHFYSALPSRKRDLKSGLFDRSANNVATRQQWPHLWLRDEYPGKNLTFMDLDFKLFVAGELEIISSDRIPQLERVARTHLLKRLTYMHRSVEWEVIRDIYIAILNQIETGLLEWGQYNTTFQGEIQWLVTKQSVDKSKPRKSQSNKAKSDIFFCRRYNAGTCSETKDHPGTARDGRKIWWKHICGTCFVKRKEQNPHREFTAECPLHGAVDPKNN